MSDSTLVLVSLLDNSCAPLRASFIVYADDTLFQSEVLSLLSKGSRQSNPPPTKVPTRVHSRSLSLSNKGPPLSPTQGSAPAIPTFVSNTKWYKVELFTVRSNCCKNSDCSLARENSVAPHPKLIERISIYTHVEHLTQSPDLLPQAEYK